jgi:hypothetical protein
MPLASVLTAVLAAASLLPAARIVAEWEPGFSEAELGGPLVVDAYGINGLGAYRVRLDDRTTALAVCIQADVGHSLGAEYTIDPSVAVPAELGYLLWAYLRPDVAVTDEQAGAVNALAWRYTGAQRRTGGPVWQGDELEVRVLGKGRLTAVERAIAALHAEATTRRGPWQLTAAGLRGRHTSVALRGPGGPIADAVVRFSGEGGWTASAVTDSTGVASVTVPDGVHAVRAEAAGPGAAVALVAPESQRLAMPGPGTTLSIALAVPAPTTTTTSSTSTTTTTTSTTTPPTTTTSTTTPPTTTTSTTTTTAPPAPATSTTTQPAVPTTTSTTPPTVTPPTLPPTGSGNRSLGRLAASLFACGALAVLVATPRRRSG